MNYINQKIQLKTLRKEQKSEELKNWGISNIISNHIIFYPTSVTLTYFWNFGSLSGIFLAIQILSGVFLAMHYQVGVDSAFHSVEHIMRDVNFGWFLRYGHSNGASFFFLVVYLHMARGLYYKSFSYENRKVWLTGILIFFLMMASAFIGYVLPWGQMSFWGATVITNFFSTIPYIGESLVFLIWGGFSVNAATLNRFFSLHYLLPLVLAAVALLHLFYLHSNGSSTSFFFESRKVTSNPTTFYPYFFVKDLVGLTLLLMVYIYFVAFKPDALGHSDNYIPASSLVTPEHIVPEWYFLPFYAILRSIPDKLGGVVLMALSIIILAALPFLLRSLFLLLLMMQKQVIKNESTIIAIPNLQDWTENGRIWTNSFFINFLLLGWIGSQPAEDPYTGVGQVMTILYFIFLFVILGISIWPKHNKM